jgi:Domain of unknown function (DUF4185)
MPHVISQHVTTASSAVPYVYVVEATGVPAPSFSLTAAPAGMTYPSGYGTYRVDASFRGQLRCGSAGVKSCGQQHTELHDRGELRTLMPSFSRCRLCSAADMRNAGEDDEEMGETRSPHRRTSPMWWLTFPITPLLLTCLGWLLVGCGDSTPGTQPSAVDFPYPQSRTIIGVSVDWSTHLRYAQGSDNWPITWADDDNQYTSWGDGGGFGGSNRKARVSLGIARIEGPADAYRGYNVWGGLDAERPAQFTGKSYGIISIDRTLYMWRSGAGSNSTAYDFQRLYQSKDHGRTWIGADWQFTREDGFFVPTFLQFGRDYTGGRDGYVYIFAPNRKTDEWAVHRPGEIVLIRVPKDRLFEREFYEFFAGTGYDGKPGWTDRVQDRKPVFVDAINGVMRTSAIYNRGLGRYLLVTEHSQRANGNIGIYEAPEPWGPWSTVLFQTGFGTPHVQANSFFWGFSNKWTSADGQRFTLLFTGRDANDSWNTVEGQFRMSTEDVSVRGELSPP